MAKSGEPPSGETEANPTFSIRRNNRCWNLNGIPKASLAEEEEVNSHSVCSGGRQVLDLLWLLIIHFYKAGKPNSKMHRLEDDPFARVKRMHKASSLAGWFPVFTSLWDNQHKNGHILAMLDHTLYPSNECNSIEKHVISREAKLNGRNSNAFEGHTSHWVIESANFMRIQFYLEANGTFQKWRSSLVYLDKLCAIIMNKGIKTVS